MAGFEPTDKVGGLSDGEMLAFLAQPRNARIATITRDGWPHVTPVWYELDPDTRRLLVVGREHALWVGHIRDNPRAASTWETTSMPGTRACSSRSRQRSPKGRWRRDAARGCST